MGKILPRSFERIRSGEQIQNPTFTNVAAAVAAGVTAAKFPRRIIYLSAGGTGSVPCLAISRWHELETGRDWRQRHLAMDGLYPIIRRKRRPSGCADVPPIPTKTEPVQPVAARHRLNRRSPRRSHCMTCHQAINQPEKSRDEDTNY